MWPPSRMALTETTKPPTHRTVMVMINTSDRSVSVLCATTLVHTHRHRLIVSLTSLHTHTRHSRSCTTLQAEDVHGQDEGEDERTPEVPCHGRHAVESPSKRPARRDGAGREEQEEEEEEVQLRSSCWRLVRNTEKGNRMCIIFHSTENTSRHYTHATSSAPTPPAE